MVFCCLTSDVSPEFSAWLREAVNTTTAGVVGLSHTPDPPSSSHRLVTLVLKLLTSAARSSRSSLLPRLLDRPAGAEPRVKGQGPEAWVRSACKLFSDLIGLQMEEM